MSDSDMGSLLDSSPPVVVEDVDDVPPSSVRIDIEGGSTTTASTDAVTMDALVALEERMATLLHVHSDEFRAVETRVAQLETLKLADLMAQAAASVSSAAADCAKAAAMAAETMRAATEVLEFVSNSDYIQGEIESHARNAALSIKSVVQDTIAEIEKDVRRVAGGKKR